MSYDKKLLDQVYKMYAEKKVNDNQFCLACKHMAAEYNSDFFGPLPIYHIGSKYFQSEKRLFIVGKVAYGWGEYINDNVWEQILSRNQNVINEIQNGIEGRVNELFLNNENQFYNVLRRSLEIVFGDANAEEAFSTIALSNLVHCNRGGVRDNAFELNRRNCISSENLGLIFEEISILKPTHILILSHDRKYINYTQEIHDKFSETIVCQSVRHISQGKSAQNFAQDIIDILSKDIK